jgi:hypothetical protein
LAVADGVFAALGRAGSVRRCRAVAVAPSALEAAEGGFAADPLPCLSCVFDFAAFGFAAEAASALAVVRFG